MKYEFIKDNPEYPVAKWAVTLKIERTGYYTWLNRRKALEEREKHLKKAIKKEFEESRGTYGPALFLRPRCSAFFRNSMAILSHNKHRSRSLTNSKKARGEGYPNILRNQSFPIVPRMGLASDITYLRTGEGFMYHCVIKDIVTGEVLGDHMADRMTKELVLKAILSMLARHRLEEGCIFHSDRGSQYTSNAVMGLLKQYGLRQSFSRVGVPGDNAWARCNLIV